MKQPKRSEEQWRDIVDEFRASGLSQAAFARKNAIAPTTLHTRVAKSSRVAEDSPVVEDSRVAKDSSVAKDSRVAKAVRFVEVVASEGARGRESKPTATLVVGGTRVEFGECPTARYMVELLRGLTQVTS